MIATRDELNAALESLPTLKPDYVRVFRGQPRDYGNMLPSGLRGSRHPDETLFNFYTQFIAVSVRDRLGDTFNDIESYLLWVRALAQHYGPGSRFLDVTRSLDVALWFALHSGRTARSVNVLGPAGPIDLVRDRVAHLDYWKFEPTADDQGLLYVFDVPEWNGAGPIEHGDLVDLQEAPATFAESARIHAQAACLLSAGKTEGGGDLSSFIVVGPLRVHRSATHGATSLAPADLFPGPQNDKWYDRFVSLPLVNRLDSTGQTVGLAQAIPVTLHFTDEESVLAVRKRLITLEPPFLGSWLKSELENNGIQRPHGFDPARAVPILLELPVFAMTPPFDSGEWNVEMAISDLPQTAEVRDAETSETSRTALDNVFVEFTPLELVDWDTVETSTSDKRFRRGALVEIRDGTFSLWLVEQALPTGPESITGPIDFERDETASLVYVSHDGKTKRPLSELPFASKTLLVVLTILRELSDKPLRCPFPTLTLDESVSVSRVQGNGATSLLRVRANRGDDLVHLLRDTESGRPFTPSKMGGIVVSKIPPACD